jgi:alpha-1,2-mannosyltransferase
LAFKPHLALGVPIALLAARRWKAFIAAGVTALGFSVVAWLVLGTAAYRAFLASMPVVREVLEHHAEDWGKLQSLYTAARLCGASLGAAYVLQAVLAAGIMAMLAVLCWRRPGAGAEAAALAAACLLCTPHVLDYDLAVTGVPLAWLAHEATRTGWRPWEKTVAGIAFVWPLVGRVLTLGAHLPLGPLVLFGLFWMVWKRGVAPKLPAEQASGVLAHGDQSRTWDLAATGQSPSPAL